MFGYRTPKRTLFQEEEIETEQSPPNRSGEASPLPVLETARTASKSSSPRSPPKKVPAGPSKKKTRAASSQEGGAATWTKKIQSKTTIDSSETAIDVGIFRPKGRLAEAKSCVMKAKLQINNSRNIKTEIKVEVLQAVDRLYQLVKEAEASKHPNPTTAGTADSTKAAENEAVGIQQVEGQVDLIEHLKEHAKLLKRNTDEVLKLQSRIEVLQDGAITYASVAAGESKRRPSEQAALHSVIVTSKDKEDSGEEILNKIRGAINAKDGGIRVDRVRKAKDRKVIVGCGTKEEREKVITRLRKAGDDLHIEEIKNKDPLIILKDVLQYNTDEDVLKALENQNHGLLKEIKEEDRRIEIRFRKKTRNPLTCHIVLRVSPKVWAVMTTVGAVHIDLQRIKVADQSPLIQCSMCLGYGHSRRFCKEAEEKCSHCGGAHLKAKCDSWQSGTAPSCCNCKRAGLDVVNHNAFGLECAVRKKWEALARATIAYC